MVSTTPFAICANWATIIGSPSRARVFHSCRVCETRLGEEFVDSALIGEVTTITEVYSRKETEI
jgi:hypothetical protein